MYISMTTTTAFLALLSQGVAAAPQLDVLDLSLLAGSADCSTVRSQCQSSPDANQATCASLAAECCDKADNTCRTGADANQATCSAEKSACYAGANLPDPYSTRRDAMPSGQACAAARSTCQSSGDPNEAACAGEAAECCDEAHDSCVAGPNANMAVCASGRMTCYVSAGLPSPYSF